MLTKELEYKINNVLQQFSFTGLLKGDMGVCIYYFVLGRMRHDPQMTQFGEATLEKIMANMGQNKILFMEEGITGIALGISFLLKYKFVEGDVNEVLQDIDDHIYKGTCSLLEKEVTPNIKLPILDVLIYFIVRYINVNSAIRKKLYLRFIEHLFNYIYIHRQDNFYQETFPFNLMKEQYLFMGVLVWIYQLGIDQKRIENIFHEMKLFLFSCHPVLHANRFHLMTVARCVGKFTHDTEWMNFAERLAQDIDIRHILENELTNKNIMPQTGVIGIWLLQKLNIWMGFAMNDQNYDFEKRIVESSLWERIEHDGEFFSNYYSLNGYCGIRLFLDYLKRKV